MRGLVPVDPDKDSFVLTDHLSHSCRLVQVTEVDIAKSVFVKVCNVLFVDLDVNGLISGGGRLDLRLPDLRLKSCDCCELKSRHLGRNSRFVPGIEDAKI